MQTNGELILVFCTSELLTLTQLLHERALACTTTTLPHLSISPVFPYRIDEEFCFVCERDGEERIGYNKDRCDKCGPDSHLLSTGKAKVTHISAHILLDSRMRGLRDICAMCGCHGAKNQEDESTAEETAGENEEEDKVSEAESGASEELGEPQVVEYAEKFDTEVYTTHGRKRKAHQIIHRTICMCDSSEQIDPNTPLPEGICECRAGDCETCWYHLKFLNLRRVPAKWICDDCRELVNRAKKSKR
ncbi:hypothetical protein M422DRAFT_264775 [Sphaerobolus stellatus SS14]|uniref:Uncharacterized protein n=1 Tax=Sphaerobolus stellatus (strain SS14) TaxID=990650 RepID=A0A0C9V711_SPHS4|nr:hypothetical protein M422DRAFT_264775 [Sphaerobolus stellatus SS14]